MEEYILPPVSSHNSSIVDQCTQVPCTHFDNDLSTSLCFTGGDTSTPHTSQQVITQDLFIPQNKQLLDELVALLDSMLNHIDIPLTDKVVNLSSHHLDEHELSLLQKGLNFCPTLGEPLMGTLVEDLDYFHDTLRWEYHFRDNPLPAQPFDTLVMTSKALRRPDGPHHPLHIKP